VVYQQLSYILNKELGYNKDQVLVLGNTWMLGNQEEVFRQRLLQDPRVLSVSTSGYLPAGPSNNNNFFIYSDDDPSKQIKALRYDVDDQYIPTLGMKIIEGRNFSRELATDSIGIILNETAAKAFGWEGDALGRIVTHSKNQGNKKTYRVIGVVKDFNFRSLHELISPLAMVMNTNSGTVIAKVQTEDVGSLLSSLNETWIAFAPYEPFDYSFLDERFQNTYQAEQKVSHILGIFAGLTIFVACLGLFGLATFTAEQRTKEIGIRKVMGASVGSILSLLSKEFVKLVVLAFIIAIPLAWFGMSRWLEDYAYRIDLEWWVFGFAGGLALLIALFIISFQSVKAAFMNPVKSLRSE
jgi:putative ABC transport system permease protein